MVWRPCHLREGLERNLALNEGFATFYADLYDEHKNGEDSLLYGLYGKEKSIFSVSNDVKPIVSRNFDNPDTMFNFLQYDKGSFVLRMLRSQLGADLYRQCIRAYLERHKFGKCRYGRPGECRGRNCPAAPTTSFSINGCITPITRRLKPRIRGTKKAKLARLSIRQNQKTGDDVLPV